MHETAKNAEEQTRVNADGPVGRGPSPDQEGVWQVPILLA